MHVGSFHSLSFFIITVKKNNKKTPPPKKQKPEEQKLAGVDGWTNIKQYANVNDQMNLFYRSPCAVLMVYKYGAWNLFCLCGNKIASFWLCLRSVTLLKFYFLSDEDWLNGGKRFIILYRRIAFFKHTDCCLSVCASVNMWQIKYRKFSNSGQGLFFFFHLEPVNQAFISSRVHVEPAADQVQVVSCV